MDRLAELLRLIKGLIKERKKRTELAGIYCKKYRAKILGTQIEGRHHGIYKD